MVFVQGGTFLMGDEAGDEYERPAHTVTVESFFLDETEVTREAYATFLAATGRKAPSGWRDRVPPEGTSKYPVTGVTWDDADAYAKWAGKRLPTEAEWEYAARGTDGRQYAWGDDWKSEHANAFTSSASRLTDVGSYPEGRSPFGALDMCGNAWEWTASRLEPYPNGKLPTPPAKNEMIIRGGCWKSDGSQATTTYRWGWLARGARDYSDTGFRCAKDGPRLDREVSK